VKARSAKSLDAGGSLPPKVDPTVATSKWYRRAYWLARTALTSAHEATAATVARTTAATSAASLPSLPLLGKITSLVDAGEIGSPD